MTEIAVKLEEMRLNGIEDPAESAAFRERHRVFPAVFENRQHKHILDVAAGVGYIPRRIEESYPAEIICNDISPTCLRTLREHGLKTISFDIDDESTAFPFDAGRFDAVIATVVIEHVISVDHFLNEINRILTPGGYLYLSAPNYTALLYLSRFLISGKTFHDPLSGPLNRYEFYSHVRYYTYNTLVEFVSTFGFVPQCVYLALPEGSTRYQALLKSSKLKALAYQQMMKLIYKSLPPRWAAEPIICFQKADGSITGNRKYKLKKTVL